MQTFSGIAADREESNTAGANADGDTLVRLVEDLDPAEVAQLRAALDAAAERGSPQ